MTSAPPHNPVNEYWPGEAELLLDELDGFDEQRLTRLLLDAWGQGCTYRRVMPLLKALRAAGVTQVEMGTRLGMSKQAVAAWYKGMDQRVIKISSHIEQALYLGFADKVREQYQQPALQQQHAFGIRWAMWRVATEVMVFDVEGPPTGPTLSALYHVWRSNDWVHAYIDNRPEAKQAVVDSLWAYMQPRWGERLRDENQVTDAAGCYIWLKDSLIDWTEPYMLTATFLRSALWPNDPSALNTGEIGVAQKPLNDLERPGDTRHG